MTIAVLIRFLLAIKSPAIIVYAAHVLSLPITSNLTSWLFANTPHLNIGVRSGIVMSTTTRAAARQQEQEEQLGKLLSLVESQIKTGRSCRGAEKTERGINGGVAGECSLSADPS